MIKSKLLPGFTILLVLLFSKSTVVKAQMVGTNAYIQGNSLEIGINGLGGYEGVNQGVSAPPVGYHARTTTLPFGFVANPQLNSWLTYDGDFFTPGTPENGWGFEIGTTGGVSQSNNYTGPTNIAGSLTSYNQIFNCITADWEGDATSGTDLHFKINYFLQTTDLYYTTTVSITNNTTATIPDLYYYRNLDPDNNVEISFDYTTLNTVVAQPGTGGCNLAHVSATSTVPASQPQSYIGLAAIGANWRAMYGGFSNRDASDIWNGTGGGFVQAVGVPNFQDEAIALGYRIQNLAPGATETFKFVVILDAASATAAVNNVLYFTYPGSASAPPAVCTPYTDTVRTCGGPVPITIGGSTVNDYTWTWSPTTGLSPTTGPSVIANPPVTTTYVATGTPISGCVSPVSLNFVVMVTPGGGNNPYITPVPPVCITDPPFNFSVDTAGGVWSGTGITSSTLGTFNPGVGAGTYLITYTTTNTCNPADTVYITVNGTDPTIAPTSPVCAGSAAFNLTAASTGGVWSGTGITNTTTGTFDPTTAGTFTVTYTISGVCTAVDTQVVVVNPVIPPTTGISYNSPVCITGPNPVLTTVPGFTSGGTFSSTPFGLSISSTTGAVTLSSSSAGTYIITYTYPATTCGPAGSSSDTLVINPLIVPVLGFSYPTVCISDTADAAPVPVSGFTAGGVYTSSPSGLVINDSTGVVDVNASTAGTYTVTYTVTGSTALCTGSGSGSATITINPLPNILISSDATVFLGQSALIFASGGTTYSWNPIQNLSCSNCDSTIASPLESTDYCVTVTELGCVDSACVRVNIEIPCPSNRNMGVPNAFTPNGDGVNDKFCLDGWEDCITDFEIVIFDRLGEKVFESSEADFCWDGIYKGKALDPAVFVYYIKAKYATAGEVPTSPKGSFDVNRTGNISLVR